MEPARQKDDAGQSTSATRAARRDSDKRTRARRRPLGRRLSVRLTAAAGALVVIGGVVWAATHGLAPAGPSGSVFHPSPTPAVHERPRFTFPITSAKAATTGRNDPNAAGDAAVEIAGSLSYFYDTVFLSPQTWKEGIPDQVWAIFEPSVRKRARNDTAALTLGDRASDLARLEVKDASISVQVLLDPAGNPRTAVAVTDFVADGALSGGEPVEVTSHASFLLRPVGGTWVALPAWYV